MLMFRLLPAAALLIGLPQSTPARTGNPPAEIRFLHCSIDSALQIARNEGKIIFVDCFTTWCGPCKNLARFTFTDSAVAAFFNQNFICVKTNMETPDGVIFQRTYPVEAYPALYFIDSNGKALGCEIGFQYPDELLRFARSFVRTPEEQARIASLKKMDSAFAAGRRDKHFLLRYFSQLDACGEMFYPMAGSLDSTITPADLKNDTVFRFFCSSFHDAHHPLSQAFGKDYAAFEKKFPEMAARKAEDIFAATIGYLVEIPSPQYSEALTAFVRNVWTGTEKESRLKQIPAPVKKREPEE